MTRGYERPSASTDPVVTVERSVAWHGTLEAPDPDQPGRYVVTLSPLFPREADVRSWARLFVSRGEVRIWRREYLHGRVVSDTELHLLEAL